MSATELAEAIRTRQASGVEVVEANLRRIETVNSSINAVVVVLGELALDPATTADRAVAAGDDVLPFREVPFTIKYTKLCPRPDVELRYTPAFIHDVMID
jgi:Asp-tRNA(Asn)/Glu-tRNA(Gln) amidotransferase A subunit family amidase